MKFHGSRPGVDVGSLPISGGAAEKGRGEDNSALVRLETGRISLEHELKLSLECLELMLASFIEFGVGDLGCLGGNGGGGCHGLFGEVLGGLDVATSGYHPERHCGDAVIALDDGQLNLPQAAASHDAGAIGVSYGGCHPRRDISANEKSIRGLGRRDGKVGAKGLPMLVLLLKGGERCGSGGWRASHGNVMGGHGVLRSYDMSPRRRHGKLMNWTKEQGNKDKELLGQSLYELRAVKLSRRDSRRLRQQSSRTRFIQLLTAKEQEKEKK